MNIPLLRSLSLKRFRSLSSAVLEFSNPTFLVGQNGAGKSNIADVFSFLSEAMIIPLPAVLDRRRGITSVEYRSTSRRRPSNLGLKVELENLDTETSRAIYAFELRGVTDYDFEVVREQCFVLRRDGSLDWFERSPNTFRSSTTTLAPALEANTLALPLVGGDKRFLPVFRFLSMMRVYRIQPDELREMQDPDQGFRLRFDGRNAASVLREIEKRSPNNWQIIRDLLEKIVPGTTDVRPKAHGDKLSLEFIQRWAESEQVTFEAHNMSDGTLRVLGLLAAVFQPIPPSVLVIEEPEVTIHPGGLGSVLDLLRHAGRFMQTIVTTHSPDILDASWIEDHHLRIVSWEEGETQIAPVSEASRVALREHLMGAGELMRSNALVAADQYASDSSEIALFEEDLK